MPELPEVEVSRLGITPHLLHKQITAIKVRQPKLRWPVPEEIQQLVGFQIERISRRAKYLILHTANGNILLHLGMSGSLRVVPKDTPAGKHDHIDIVVDSDYSLRLTDPRRFGACLFQAEDTSPNPLLDNLGPEPLTDAFDGQRLYDLSRNRKQAVKTFIMDNKIVVGVGNIYANESLFLAGIDPRKAAGKVTKQHYLALGEIIKQVLAKAISQGGTTLKDFAQADGKPGYFAQELLVYGRNGEACVKCAEPIESVVIGQRNTFYCAKCQR